MVGEVLIDLEVRVRAMERVSGLLGGPERAVLPQDLDVLRISSTRGEDLHQEDLIERRAQDREPWPLYEHLALVLIEGRGEVRPGAVVQPRRRQAMAGGHPRYRCSQVGVDGSGAVDVTRCLSKPVERKERPTNDDKCGAADLRSAPRRPRAGGS